MTYTLMGCSTILLLLCAGALLKWPKPRCCCYAVDYSDAAIWNGTPCCPCMSIRQANNTMILMWALLLMCRLAIGIELPFLYPFLGFSVLHLVTSVAVHMLVRGYRHEDALQQDGSGPPQHPRAQPAAPAAMPSIQTMSAELVVVVQPDYDACCGDGGDAGGGGGKSGLRRAGSSTAVGALGGPGRSASGDVARTSGPGRGLAWALRYTRVGQAALARLPSSPKLREEEPVSTTAAATGLGAASPRAGSGAASSGLDVARSSPMLSLGRGMLRSRTYGGPHQTLDSASSRSAWSPSLASRAYGGAGGGGGSRGFSGGGATCLRSASCGLPAVDDAAVLTPSSVDATRVTEQTTAPLLQLRGGALVQSSAALGGAQRMVQGGEEALLTGPGTQGLSYASREATRQQRSQFSRLRTAHSDAALARAAEADVAAEAQTPVQRG